MLDETYGRPSVRLKRAAPVQRAAAQTLNHFFFLLAASLVVSSLAHGAERPHDKRGTEQQPLIIQTLPAQPSSEELKREELHATERAEDASSRQQEAARRDATDTKSLWLGGLTALIFAIQAIAFFIQAAQLRRSVEEMKNATAATQLAARAAERTVARMKLTAVRQLRAYVSVKTARVSTLEVGRHPVATITVANYGQTPAYGFATAGQMDFVVSNRALPTLRESIPTGHLGPSGEYILTATCPLELNAHSLDQLKTGAAVIFVHGIVNYIDTYGEKHFTRFRMKIGGGGVPLGAGIHSCNEGNETDDDERIFTAAGKRGVHA